MRRTHIEVTESKETEIYPIPTHVAIIMDGNGRWAKQRGKPRLYGHRAGTENIRKAIDCFYQHGVKYITLYAFSTENWSRPNREVLGILRILYSVIDRESRALNEKGVRIRHIGRLDRLSSQLKNAIENAIENTKNNTKLSLQTVRLYLIPWKGLT